MVLALRLARTRFMVLASTMARSARLVLTPTYSSLSFDGARVEGGSLDLRWYSPGLWLVLDSRGARSFIGSRTSVGARKREWLALLALLGARGARGSRSCWVVLSRALGFAHSSECSLRS